jgi:uncharacterized membrane protein YeiH
VTVQQAVLHVVVSVGGGSLRDRKIGTLPPAPRAYAYVKKRIIQSCSLLGVAASDTATPPTALMYAAGQSKLLLGFQTLTTNSSTRPFL